MSASPLNYQEAERLRELLSNHDRANKPREFDLAHPPVAPYEFRKFPKMVYDHSKAQPARDEVRASKDGPMSFHVPAMLGEKIVNNEKELEKAIKAGFQEQPPTFE
jgi:hypothetical protein